VRAWIGRLLGVLLLALLLPPSAYGQASVQSLLERGAAAGADAALMRTVATRAEAAGLAPAETARLLRPAVTLAERDLPTDPLLNKALEGLAKQVPPGRMAPVLESLRSHTQEAGALVSRWTATEGAQTILADGDAAAAGRTRLVTSIAEARQQNLPARHVEQFLDRLPSAVTRRSVSLAEVATAVSVMPDLPAARSAPAASQELLAAALNAGYDAESLRQLPAALAEARRTAARPGSALTQGAARAIANGTPAASVLQTLFRGRLPGQGPPSGPDAGPPSTPAGQGKPPPSTGPPDDPGGGNPGGGNPGGGNPGGGPPL
jgi:hypothetical protein